MPSAYVSGNARQTVPSASRWSFVMLFSSPPRYCAGVRTLGKIRETTKSFNSRLIIVARLRTAGIRPGARRRRPSPPIRASYRTAAGLNSWPGRGTDRIAILDPLPGNSLDRRPAGRR